MTDTRVWYLAHPVAGDEKFTIGQNLTHSLEVARIVWDAGYRVILPWHTHCLFLDDSNPEHRATGMECNRQILESVGRIILVGHKLSGGMEAEAKIVSSLIGGVLIDLIGVSDRDLTTYLRRFQ